MDIAVTLVIQGIAFFLTAVVAKPLVWDPLMKMIAERQQRIAEGLAAGSKGQQDLDAAKLKADQMIRDARDKAAQIVDQAAKRSNEMIEEAKAAAQDEGRRIVKQAHEEISLDTTRAREGLRKQVAMLAVQGASRLLEREIDPKAHESLLNKLELEMAGG